jgi:putative SOS response-associated peptidase YedK
MCGRYVIKSPSSKLKVKFHLDDVPLFEPRYNVAPTQTVPAVRDEDGKRRLAMLHWGLIPSWSKDLKIGYRLINARADTVASKPSFRSAFKKRRCLLAADGFYEWQKIDTKTKQPFFIHMKDDEPFAFAGLWETWHDAAGEEVQTLATQTPSGAEPMRIGPPATERARPLTRRL